MSKLYPAIKERRGVSLMALTLAPDGAAAISPWRKLSSYHTSFHIASTGPVPVWSENLTTKSSDNTPPFSPESQEAIPGRMGMWQAPFSSYHLYLRTGTSPTEDFVINRWNLLNVKLHETHA